MKYLSTLVALLFSGLLSAQDSIPRTPLVEVFTSSTCGPCRPGNEGINSAYVEDETMRGRYTMIKYQMSWPGNGDPYYHNEGRNRRGFYSVTGVPDMYLNGTTKVFPTTSLTNEELKTEMARYSYLEITPHYKVTNDGKTFDIDVSLKALQQIEAPASKVFIAIVELETKNNKKNNGESEFEYVMKKTIPSAGELIIGNLNKDTLITMQHSYTFQGNYRLPADATDQIDHTTEHSVEDFNNLRVLVWVQNLSTKEVYNSGWGFDKDDSTHDYHPQNPNNPLGDNYDSTTIGTVSLPSQGPSLLVYPNPSEGEFDVELGTVSDQAQIAIYDLKGNLVFEHAVKANSASHQVHIDLRKQPQGVYVLKLIDGDYSAVQRIAIE